MQKLIYIILTLFPFTLNATIHTNLNDKVLKVVPAKSTSIEFTKEDKAARTFHIGETIQFNQKGNFFEKSGEIIAITDETIIIKQNNSREIIPISEIKSIRRPTTFRGITGLVMLTTSIILILIGIAILFFGLGQGGAFSGAGFFSFSEVAGLLLASAVIMVAGIFGLKIGEKRFIPYQKYKLKKRWKLEVQPIEK